MTHTTIDYSIIDDRIAADEIAIDDIKVYVGDAGFREILYYAVDIWFHRNGATIKGLRTALNFVGVEGYPVDAFCRRLVLGPYREWMEMDAEGGPVWLDEDGFPFPNSFTQEAYFE